MIENNSEPPSEPAPAPSPPPAPPAPPQPSAVPASDPWTDRLKQNMVRDRKRLRRNVAIVAAFLVLLAAGGLWLIYPGPALPPLYAVAFDAIALPDEDVQVRLQLEPIDPGLPFPKNLARLKVTFADQARQAPPLAKTVTDKTGQALAAVHFADAAPVAKFQGRFHGTRQAKPSIDEARVCFIPRNAELVLIDVQDLRADPTQDLAGKDLNRILPHQPSAKLLQSLRAEKKHIVYLALKSERAEGYQLARRWLRIMGQAFPPGPILGRPSYHDGKTAEEAQRQIIGDLSNRWKVQVVGRQ